MIRLLMKSSFSYTEGLSVVGVPGPSAVVPRVRRRRWWVIALALVLYLGAVVPGSPIHLGVLFRPSPNDNGRGVRQLIHALGDPDASVRRDAAEGLGRLNIAATDALPRLADLLRRDPDATVRAAAADAIRKMAPASRDTVSDLAAAVHDPDPSVRMGAALALLSLKESAQAAVPDLIAGSIDEENDTDLEIFPLTVRQAMLRALGTAAAGTAAAVPTLSAVLDGPAPDATWAISLRGLGLARRYAADTAPVVRALLRHPDADVRYAAEEALGRIGVDRAGPVRASEYDHLELPESERQRIWEIEHRVNVLNKFGFDPLSAALGHGNPAELTRFFAPAFNGTEPANPKRVNSAGFAHVERLESSGAASISLTTPQFVARLAGLRKEFGNDPKVKVVVATLHPKDLAVPDGMWEGRAQLRMAGESRPGAPAEVTATIDFEVLPPTEEGLMAGGWLRAAHLRQLATAQAPHSLFVEVAKARGLDTASLYDNWTADELVPSSGGVYVTDFDRDGYLDLLVTDLNSTTLYRGGPGGTFTNVTAAMGLPTTGSWSHKAAWADLDGDGWDDLILHERVYRNEGGVKFTDYTERCTPKLPKYRSSILVADYNRDGKLDLYITRTGRPGSMSWLQGRSNDTRGNVLLRNLGDWKFEDVTRKSGTRGG